MRDATELRVCSDDRHLTRLRKEEVAMLGMFQNRKDSQGLDDDLTTDFVHQRARHRARLARETADTQLEQSAALALAIRLREMTELAEISAAERDATFGVIAQLVDITDPEKLEKIRRLRSRAIDKEFERLLAAGALSSDPRQDPEWRQSINYRPA
jgi:hypothetical protein